LDINIIVVYNEIITAKIIYIYYKSNKYICISINTERPNFHDKKDRKQQNLGLKQMILYAVCKIWLLVTVKKSWISSYSLEEISVSISVDALVVTAILSLFCYSELIIKAKEQFTTFLSLYLFLISIYLLFFCFELLVNSISDFSFRKLVSSSEWSTSPPPDTLHLEFFLKSGKVQKN
jgi:hypothetical protein